MPIYKSQNIDDIPKYDKEYWHAKTPQERLNAALELILFTKKLYKANPNNKPLGYGGRIFKSRTPIKRGER